MADRIRPIDDRAWMQEKRREETQRRTLDRRPDLQQIARSEVAIDMLEATPEYRGFLEQVQALHDDASTRLAAAEAKERASTDMNHANLIAQKLLVMEMVWRQSAFKEVLDLAQKNRALAQKAKDQLVEDDAQNA